VTRRWILTHNGSTHAKSDKGVHFVGLHDGRLHLRGQISLKTVKKIGVVTQFQATLFKNEKGYIT